MNYTFFFFSSRRRHTRFKCDWSSDVCSSDLRVHARHSAPQEPGEAQPQRRAAAAPLSASVAGRAHQRLAALLSRLGRTVGVLPLHVRGLGVFEFHPYGFTTVLKQSLARSKMRRASFSSSSTVFLPSGSAIQHI